MNTPQELKLSNGIPVILQHIDGAVAATYWWVKTGSADEVGKETGFAHFLEHMLFKDAAAKETGKASTGKMARAIESLGGDINAYTSFDQTVYHVTCAATHWERVIDAFGLMAKPQRFLKSDFEREREVILEELRKNEDSPSRQLFQKLFSEVFARHPYGRPVIGFQKILKAAKVAELEAFYKRNYISGNMGLILVGPIEDGTGARQKKIMSLLEKHYGAKVLKPQKALVRTRVQETELRKQPSIATTNFDVKTPSVSIAFRVPQLSHADLPALDLLSGILGMGELSRVYQRLFYETSLVTEVGGGLYVPNDPGMLYFQAEMESPDKINTVVEEIFKILKRIAEEGPNEEELKRVMVSAESEKLYSTQTADGMASRIGFLKFIIGDLQFDQKYLEQLRAVDASMIREAAGKYFDPQRMSVVVMLPKDVKNFDTAPIAKLAAQLLPKPAVVPAAKAQKKMSGEIPVEFFKLPSGIKVAYLHRPQSHVIAVQAAALGGTRLEPRGIEGTAHLFAQTWAKGAGEWDSRAIARIVEGSAASLDGFSGRNSVGLQLTGLARDWGKLSNVFSTVLCNPTFPEEEIVHNKRITEDALKGIEDHSSQLCSKHFLETLFEHHPYGKLTYGNQEALPKITRENLRELHRSWIRPDRLTVSISGAVKREVLELWLNDLDQRMKKISASGSSPAAVDVTPELILKAPRWIEKNLKREQVHIMVGGLGTRIYDEDRYPIRIMQNVLGGQSGRLFIELREKKSLGYTVAPMSFEGVEPGYIGTYIASAPAKRAEAIEGIKKVLETLAAKGPTATEIERAKEFYLGRRAMDMQGDSSLASHFGLEEVYGIKHLSEAEITAKVRAVTGKKIQDVCRRYLVEPYMVTSIVG